MENSNRKLLLEIISVLFFLVVVVVSASTMEGVKSNAQLLSLIAGSFGAGATLTNAVRNHALRRRSGQ